MIPFFKRFLTSFRMAVLRAFGKEEGEIGLESSRVQRGIYVFLFIVLTSFSGGGFKLVKTIPLKGVSMTTDKLGNIYVVTDQNQILKYDSKGTLLANYSDKSMGKLKLADASNPLKILLLYSDFNQITTLDNKLSLRTQITLRDLNILQPQLICSSINDGIWIFDQQDFQLKRLDMNLNIVQESGNLMQVTGKVLKPIQILENNNYIYMNSPATGIMIFDLFGSYYKTIPIIDVEGMQFNGEELYYLKKGKLNAYNIKTISERAIPLPEQTDTNSINIRIEEQNIYELKNQQLNIYSGM